MILKINKIFVVFFSFIALSNGGVSTSAFLGPAYTGVKTGSVYQTSLSYSSGKIVNHLKLESANLSNHKKKIINKNPILPDIPYTTKHPQVVASYKVNKVEFSDLFVPEPLP